MQDLRFSDGSPALRAPARRVIAALAAIALVVAGAPGCAYHSEYVAPVDGRARVVWANDRPSVELAGTSPELVCGMEVRRLTGHETAPLTDGGQLSLDSPPFSDGPGYRVAVVGGYWTPRYYGSNLNIVLVRPGRLLPPLLRPPLFFPTLIRPVGGVRVIGAPSVRISSSGGSGFKTRGGSGGGGGGKGGEALVIAAIVVVVTALPAIALGFASSFPESSGSASRAIDFVNAYNDLLRSDGSPCAPVLAAAPPYEPLPGGGAP
jgi:hypothetical protein